MGPGPVPVRFRCPHHILPSLPTAVPGTRKPRSPAKPVRQPVLPARSAQMLCIAVRTYCAAHSVGSNSACVGNAALNVSHVDSSVG
jgi:hypothetical protein